MNKKLFKIAISALTLGSANLFAAENASIAPYASIKAGFNKPGSRDSVKYKNGFAGSVAVGGAYDAWRAEVELAYFQAKIKDSSTNTFVLAGAAQPSFDKVNTLAGMVNVYYDYPATDTLTVFVGAGAGVAKQSLHRKALSLDLSKTSFAYQLFAGVGYDITENVTAEVSYRMFNATGKIKNKTNAPVAGIPANSSVKAPFYHVIELGLRYTF